jgi:hypothetical protein
MSSPDTSFTVNQQLSLYIPEVLSNTTAEEIATLFEKFDFGKVRCVDLVSRKKSNSAHVYFDEWNTSGMVSRFQEKVYNGTASMFYEDPYLWKVFENKPPPATNAAGAQLLKAIQKPINTNALGAQLLKAIQKPINTNALGAQLLMSIDSFTLNQCKDRICVLENEVASMKQMLIEFDEKKLASLSSEIMVMQDYLAKKNL